MKTKQTCPKCECRRLFVVERVAQRDHHSPNGIVRLSVTTVKAPATSSSLRDEIGRLEAWICSRCSYVEWYAKDALFALEECAARGDGEVRVVDAETTAYR